MKVAVLFSGGKDSCMALMKAMKFHEIECLITIVSNNKESYMFHTPNIGITKIQSKAIKIPVIQQRTKGEEEKELDDLKEAIKKAKQKFKIKGIVTGAIRSIYQAKRVQKICKDLDLYCFNPLWLGNQIELLEEILRNKFEVVISGVFAYPLDEKLLGKKIDDNVIALLKSLQEKYLINPAGEGGEIETTVLNAPFFNKKIKIIDYKKKYSKNSGVFQIKRAILIRK